MWSIIKEFFNSLNTDTLARGCKSFYGQVCLYNRWTARLKLSVKITLDPWVLEKEEV